MIRFLLVDGSYLAYRSFKASGQVAKNFLYKLFDLERDLGPMIVGVCWDGPWSRALRAEKFPDYKAGRPPKETEYLRQMGELRSVLPWFDVVQYEGPGEADDVLATLTRTMPGPHVIYTADKDMLQLVAHGVSVLKAGATRAKPDMMITWENIVEETGLDPKGWTDFLTLAGDKVDNITGLSGVGKGYAMAILKACPAFVDLVLGAADDDYVRAAVASSDSTISKWVEKAIKERGNLKASLDLVTLYDIPLAITEGDPEPEQARRWLDAMDLGRLIERIP